MLRLELHEKNPFKTKFGKFEAQINLKLIYFLVLLLILILNSLYFYRELKESYFTNKFIIFDQYLMKNGFRIKNIDVIGLQNLSQDYFNNIINKHNDVNIFYINLGVIYNEIIKNSWIKEAKIERVLPDTIKIKILEKKPIAIWQNKKGNKLVTLNGEIISNGNVNTFKNNFPIIKGYKAKENISSILKILETDKNLSKNIWSLRFISQRRWDLYFDQGLIVRLPSQNINKAWQKIVKLQQHYNILNLRLTEIDLRNPDQILGKINFDKKFILKRKHL